MKVAETPWRHKKVGSEVFYRWCRIVWSCLARPWCLSLATSVPLGKLDGMARPSRVARESIFNSGPQLHGHELQAACSPSLLECVQNLEDINAETHDAQLLLRAGTSDLKRVSHVLASQRVSDLGTVAYD